MPHHTRAVEDCLNILSGTIIRHFALMLELDRKATELGGQLDALRGPYLVNQRQRVNQSDNVTSPTSIISKLSPTAKKTSTGSTRRQTRRSQTPTARTPRHATLRENSKQSSTVDDALDKVEELQHLQDRLWAEKILVGKQCLSAIENAASLVDEASLNISQQLIATSSAAGEYNAASFSTTSAGTHRTSMRTAALIASQAMHQSLTEATSNSWRNGDNGGSSVISRTRKRQS